jgi:hypothetical protein
MTPGDRGIVDDNVVIRQPADTIESDFERNLSSAIEKPTVNATGLDRDFTWSERLQFTVFGAEREANFAGDSMPPGRMFDAAAGGAKCIPSGVPFEMNAQ